MNKSVRSGVLLIVAGVIFILFRTFDFGENLVLPLMGAGFITWSILWRNKGLMIPGGILSGIALGVALSESGLAERMGSEASGALFLFGFAAGWFVITLFTHLFFNQYVWWPMIPGGIMAAVGLITLLNSNLIDVTILPGRFWPVILIVIGCYIIWNQFRKDDAAGHIYEKSPKDLV